MDSFCGLFADTLTQKNINMVQAIFCNEEYFNLMQNIKRFYSKRKITNGSCELVRTIQQETGILLFPVIFVVGAQYGGKSAYLLDKHGLEYYILEPCKEYIKKSKIFKTVVSGSCRTYSIGFYHNVFGCQLKSNS